MKQVIYSYSLRVIIQYVDLRKLYEEHPSVCADLLLLNKDLETKPIGKTILITDLP